MQNGTKIGLALVAGLFLFGGLLLFGSGSYLEDSNTSGKKWERAGFNRVSAFFGEVEISEGQQAARKCRACHSFEEGGRNRVGPPLYGVLGRTIGSVEGFSYSGALRDYGRNKNWTYQELDGFLQKPRSFVKGTSMAFAGLEDDRERAAMIIYLRSLSNAPAPLPGF